MEITTEFVKGQFIRWVADRYSKSWDVYGIILDAEGNHYDVKSFDDLSVTRLHKLGEAVTDGELRPAKMADVLEWLSGCIGQVDTRRTVVTAKYNEELNAIDTQLKQIGEAIEFVKIS